jgi:hypothetical protein
MRDDVYYELDRDYYDLKDYVKRRVNHHNKHYHKPQAQEDVGTTLLIDENNVQATNDATTQAVVAAEPLENDDNVVIIDENMVIIDGEVQQT